MVVEGLAQSVVTLMVVMVMVMAGQVTVSAHRHLSYKVSVKLQAEAVTGSNVGEKLLDRDCNNVSRRRNSRKVMENDIAETAVVQQQAQQHSITHPLTSTSPQQKQNQGQQELESTVEDQQQKEVMMTVRVAAEEWVPHIGVSQDTHGNITIRGPMANLLTLLAKALNFRYTLVRPPDGAWGIPTEGGDWNGMIGMVKRNEADLALGPFGLTYSRSRVVDFSSPILIDYYRILVRRPRPETDPIGFLRPFTWEVWVGLVMCVWVVGGVLFLAASLHSSPQSKKQEKEEKWGRRNKKSTYNKDDIEEGPISQFLTQLWLVYGSLLSQPEVSYADERWRLGQGWRVAAAGWCVAALVVARSYSSALTSLLAVRNVPVRYNYLTEVIADPKLNLVFEKATALVEHMSTVQRGVYRDLADTRGQDRANFLASSALYDAAYTTVRSGTHALLVEDTTCRKVYSDDFTKHGRCDFYIGKERYWPLIFSIIGRKGSHLMPAINARSVPLRVRLDQMVAQDLYFKWLGEELPNATACLGAATRVTVTEPYSLLGLWGVFIIFAGGLMLGVVVLGCERGVVAVRKL
ncbi:hypothetical protein Pmani_016169 [Petrolisthes manimaculis]|uniref:Uncharacterized protein n=1 Tax=Petrolisthes manimaculis TaxID=1843537 RepID=A0AAE1PS88_9EUCA|nr:hypothetical protein Pmani_016169 [Petrolisthes manimaculis]